MKISYDIPFISWLERKSTPQYCTEKEIYLLLLLITVMKSIRIDVRSAMYVYSLKLFFLLYWHVTCFQTDRCQNTAWIDSCDAILCII